MLKFFSVKSVMVSLVTGVSVFCSFLLMASPLDPVSINVVSMPSGYPVIWPNKNAYGLPDEIDINDTSYSSECLSSTGCNADAVSLGAIYYHQSSVEGYGLVVAYYDEDGRIVGTKLGGLEAGDGSENSNPPPSITSYADSAGNTVGYLDGSFSVSAMGAATYNVPIAIPPGTAGVQPEIALQYSSQAGEGVAGLGWSIAGISSISRCGKTVAQNGVASGVNFSPDDVFCLDGQQLVKVGDGLYGGDNTSYKTEIDSYSSITSQDSDRDRFPESFTVKTKAGEIISYGTTSSSRVFRRGSDITNVSSYDRRVLSWNIARTADRKTNYIDYIYTADHNTSTDTTDHRVKEIKYTGNTAIGQSPFASIVFNYKDRIDTSSIASMSNKVRYVKGFGFHTAKMLDNVEIKLEGSALRTYNLNYYDLGSQTHHMTAPQLKSIEECAVTHCLPKTWIMWDGSHASNTDFVGGQAIAPVSEGLAQRPPNNQGIAVPDASVFLPEETGESKFISSNELNQFGTNEAGFNTRLIGDVNGDGRSDIVMVRANGAGSVRIALSNGHGFKVKDTGNTTNTPGIPFSGEPYMLADVNGDGLSDLVHFAYDRVKVSLSEFSSGQYNLKPEEAWVSDGSAYYTYSSGHTSLNNSPRFVQDMNGDGMADIVSIYSTGTYVALSNGTSFDKPTAKWSSVMSTEAGDKYENFAILDITGDGLPEVARIKRADSQPMTGILVLENENNFSANLNTAQNWPFSSPDPINSDIRYGDFNGDGIADLASYHKTSQNSHDVYIRYSTGKKFTPKSKAIPGYYSSGSMDRDNVLDVNGDGLSDFVRFGSNGPRVDINRGGSFGGSWWSQDFKNGSGYSHAYSMRSFGDFNGDGLVDIVSIDNDGVTIGENKIEPQRITRIISGGYVEPTSADVNNGLNRSVEILYDKLTATDTSYSSAIYTREHNSAGDMDWIAPVNKVGRQFGMFVVSAHYSSNGSIRDNRNRHAGMSYTYKGLGVDSKGRGIQGFAERTVVDTQKRSSTTEYYHQDYPLTGTTRASVSRSGSGAILSISKNSPSSEVLSDGNSSKPYYRTYSDATSEFSYSLLGGQKFKTSTTSYLKPDACGNYPKITNYLYNNITSDWTKKTTTSNYPTSTDCFVASRLTSSSVKHERSGAPSAIIKNAAFRYTAEGQVEAETVEPGHTKQLVTSYQYTVHGNVKLKTVTGKGLVGSPSSISSRSIKTTRYDRYGRFPEVVENDLGHKTITLYDERFGTAMSSTDANGLTSESRVNEFGQSYVTTSPTGNSSHTVYEWCRNTINSMDVRYCTTTVTRDGGYTKKYFDQLDRVVRTETRGVGEGGSTTIWVDKVYDLLNSRLQKQSLPYYSDKSPQWVEYDYDELDRTISITQPTLGEASVAYDGLTTTKTNAKGQATTLLQTADGKTSKVTDNLGNQINHLYYADGNLRSTVVTASTQGGQQSPDKNNIKTEFEYDVLGHKTRMIDPDMGTWQYSYNALGELISQADPTLRSTSIRYDLLGRMSTRRSAVDSLNTYNTETWVYDSAPGKGKGKIHRVYNNRNQKTFTYNDLGQASGVEERLINDVGSTLSASAVYNTQNTYDGYGRLSTVTYPTANPVKPVVVRNHYKDGILNKVTNGNNSVAHWQLNEANASGQVTEQKLGNGVVNSKLYDELGRLQEILSDSNDGSSLQHLRYVFDDVGNLSSRDDLNAGLFERFDYDGLNRLTRNHIQRPTGPEATGPYLQYDGHGNLTYKGSTRYRYLGAGAHAVSSIGAQSLSYDAYGNMRSGLGRTITYTEFNKPSRITKNGKTTELEYGVDRQRVLKKTSAGKTWYVDGHYERVQKNDGAETHKFYIKAGTETVAYINQYKTATGAWNAEKTSYLLKDHLGSTDVVTNEPGQRIHKLSFDAWGQRRSAGNWYGLDSYWYNSVLAELESTALTLGFTGHEHDDEVGLINMKGRLYDPEIGRFISADPHIQATNDTQSYNRYSYVKNNPLSYTDPSGYFFKKLFKKIGNFFKKYGRTILAIAVTAFVPGLAGGFLSGMISSGGDLQQGIIGAFSAGLFGAIGTSFGPTAGLSIAGKVAKTLAHGVAGGVTSVLRGGKFKEGFVSAGMSQVLEVTGAYNKLGVRAGARGFAGRAKNVVVSALVGGTMSKAVGGKFANGAITGAFSRMFNDHAHELAKKARALEINIEETEIRMMQKRIYSSGAQFARSGNYYTSVDGDGNLSYVDLTNPPNGMLANSTPLLNVFAVGYTAKAVYALAEGAIAGAYLGFNNAVYSAMPTLRVGGYSTTGDAFVMDYMTSMIPGSPTANLAGVLGLGGGYLLGSDRWK